MRIVAKKQYTKKSIIPPPTSALPGPLRIGQARKAYTPTDTRCPSTERSIALQRLQTSTPANGRRKNKNLNVSGLLSLLCHLHALHEFGSFSCHEWTATIRKMRDMFVTCQTHVQSRLPMTAAWSCSKSSNRTNNGAVPLITRMLAVNQSEAEPCEVCEYGNGIGIGKDAVSGIAS